MEKLKFIAKINVSVSTWFDFTMKIFFGIVTDG